MFSIPWIAIISIPGLTTNIVSQGARTAETGVYHDMAMIMVMEVAGAAFLIVHGAEDLEAVTTGDRDIGGLKDMNFDPQSCLA